MASNDPDAGVRLHNPTAADLYSEPLFGIVGATLLVGNSRAERRPGLLWSTMLASVPGAMFVTYVLISFVRFFFVKS